MATRTHTTSRRTPEAAIPAPGRRSLFGTAAAALLATPALAAQGADPDHPATPADFTALEFEPVPSLTEALGTWAEWHEDIKGRFPTLFFAAGTMAKTPDELAAMAAAEPEAVCKLVECMASLRDKLEAEAEVVGAAVVRLLAGCARAGLV